MKLTDKDLGFRLEDFKGNFVYSKHLNPSLAKPKGHIEYEFIIVTEANKDDAYEYATTILKPATLASDRKAPKDTYVIKFSDMTDMITPFDDKLEAGQHLYHYIAREDNLD